MSFRDSEQWLQKTFELCQTFLTVHVPYISLSLKKNHFTVVAKQRLRHLEIIWNVCWTIIISHNYINWQGCQRLLIIIIICNNQENQIVGISSFKWRPLCWPNYTCKNYLWFSIAEVLLLNMSFYVHVSSLSLQVGAHKRKFLLKNVQQKLYFGCTLHLGAFWICVFSGW